MRTMVLLVLLIMLYQSACNSTTERSPSFSFIETDGTIELLEGSDPVLVYQKALKSPNGKNFFNNYIHPLYSLGGDTITEEFPADHLHHRGIFWAWHKIYLDTLSIGDGWMMDKIANDIVSVQTHNNRNSAVLNASVLWTSPNYKNHTPFLQELTTITVHKSGEDYRMIVFPGGDKVPLSMESPTALHYRLIIDDGSADGFDIAKFQSD